MTDDVYSIRRHVAGGNHTKGKICDFQRTSTRATVVNECRTMRRTGQARGVAYGLSTTAAHRLAHGPQSIPAINERLRCLLSLFENCLKRSSRSTNRHRRFSRSFKPFNLTPKPRPCQPWAPFAANGGPRHEREIGMSSYTEKLKLDAGGDVLEVNWTGSVWVAPSCGAQHATRHDAMQVELYHYLAACGEEVEIDDVDPDEYGDWIDSDEEE